MWTRYAHALVITATTALASCGNEVTSSGDKGGDSVPVNDTDPIDGDDTIPGDGDDGPGDDEGTDFGLTRVVNTTCSLGTPATQTVFEGLGTGSLTGLMPIPGGNGVLALSEQKGRVVAFNPQGYTAGSEHEALNIEDKVFNNDAGEKGQHSIAFAPNFGVDGGYLYVMYSIENESAADNRDSRVERYTCNRNGGLTCDKDSARTVIEIERPDDYGNHNGGQIFFGGDGYLYITMGDSGSGGDPLGWAQDVTRLQGKILRIDPSTDDGVQHYTIPADNPLVAESGAKPEIYAYGLRNPWRASYDADSGRIFLADVGQGAWEEIDIIVAGGNYGWDQLEGTHSYNGGSCPDNETCIPPIYEYQHESGRLAITGGFVYRGSKIPGLRGAYVFADYASGEVWRLDEDNEGHWAASPLFDAGGSVTSFGVDANGELYTLHLDGSIQRVVAGATDNAPPTLTATGCYSDVAARAVAAGVQPYELRVPFWSDGEAKKRYLVLPGTQTIEATVAEEWSFPVGTIIIKEFELQEIEGDPDSTRPIETRFLLHAEQDVWRGYSYRWNEEKTEATLLDNTDDEIGTYIMNGGVHEHVFPTRSSCNVCHTSSGGFVLGVRTEQLNRDVDYGRGQVNQIAALADAGFLAAALADSSTWPALAVTSDTSESLGKRARSYLAVNCSSCHNGTAQGGREPDMRLATSMEDSKLCVAVDRGIPIEPGSSSTSPIISERIGIRGTGQMPPLATLITDSVGEFSGVTIVSAWIDAMDDEPAVLSPEYICPAL